MAREAVIGTQAEVGNGGVGMVDAQPVHAGDDIGAAAEAVVAVEHADGDDLGLRGNAGRYARHALATGGDAGDIGAVRVGMRAAARAGLAGAAIGAATGAEAGLVDDAAGEAVVVKPDAAVDDRDLGAGASQTQRAHGIDLGQRQRLHDAAAATGIQVDAGHARRGRQRLQPLPADGQRQRRHGLEAALKLHIGGGQFRQQGIDFGGDRRRLQAALLGSGKHDQHPDLAFCGQSFMHLGTDLAGSSGHDRDEEQPQLRQPEDGQAARPQ